MADRTVLELSAASRLQKQRHDVMLFDLEAKKVAANMVVPTLAQDVRDKLRELGQPVRLFGENLANVRDRLRLELAKVEIQQRQQEQPDEPSKPDADEWEEQVTKYTRGSSQLLQAREQFAAFSLQRAQNRLQRERHLRAAAVKRKRQIDDQKQTTFDVELERLDTVSTQIYKQVQKIGLEGTQYGDSRSLSCIESIVMDKAQASVLVTGSWTGSLQVWDGSSLKPLSNTPLCHEDRIMGLSSSGHINDNNNNTLLCTTSIDLSAKLWKLTESDSMQEEDTVQAWKPEPVAHLQGHAARLCKSAFHPMGRHVATTSYDHTWRLWDVEHSANELLLQDGHWKPVYGIGFHPDGSLVATTDFAGVVHIWDLRTGKSIRHFMGHAGRVLNAQFQHNGFQLATAGDDGTIKIWDLRRRKQAVSIPAHTNLVTKLVFDESSEYMVSSSFDGTVKLWNTRNWKMLHSLHGHEGPVTGVDIVRGGSSPAMVSCGFDKTLKLWR